MNLDDRHIVAAGKALKVLKDSGDIYDAQVSIAVMSAYLCSQNNFIGEVFSDALLKNMLEINNNPLLMRATIERCHNVLHEKKAIQLI